MDADPALLRLTRRLEGVDALDGVIAPVARAVARLPRPVRNLLHGVSAGHPIHPVAVLIPTGAWMSASALDVLPGGRRAARRLVGIGILTAAPAIAAGLVDWSVLRRDQQRVGAVHAVANGAGLLLYVLSWIRRRRGHGGKLSAAAGLSAISLAGYLGGHLTYRQGAGVHDS